MPNSVSSFVFLFVSGSLWAQHPYPDKAKVAVISHVKTVDASSLDRRLPKVTLEFFLKYEGEGAPIGWQVSKCDQLNRNQLIDRERDGSICVEANINLKGDRSATVVVSVGTLKTGAATVFRVTVTDPSGMVHAVRRLSDLPMELHRPLPQSPRDLPLPVGAALLPLPAGNSPNMMTVVLCCEYGSDKASLPSPP